MTDAEAQEGSSFDPVLADIGANLVVILLILIAISTRAIRTDTEPATDLSTATITAPLSGKGHSDVLHRRLHPLPGQLVVELTDSGPMRPVGGGRTQPLLAIPEPSPDAAIVFVFSPRHYDELVEKLAAARIAVAEVTVPDALRRTGSLHGLSAFSDSFLSLPVTEDPASIRPPLLRLLTDGKSGAAFATAAPDSTWTVARRWLHLCANLTGALLSGYVLFRTHRRRH